MSIAYDPCLLRNEEHWTYYVQLKSETKIKQNYIIEQSKMKLTFAKELRLRDLATKTVAISILFNSNASFNGERSTC